MWSVVENDLLLVTAPIISQLARSELLCFSFDDVTGFCRPSPYFFTKTYLEILQLEGGVSISQRKDEAKRFPAELFTTLRMNVPYISSRIAKMSTPTGLHGPPQRNLPEDISLTFW